MAMVVKATGGDYTPHPEGPYAGVLVDVIDMGEKANKFGMKNWIRLVYLTEEPILIGNVEKLSMIRRDFTKTLGRDSNLKKFLEQWRGKKFTDEELEGFDVEGLLGIPGLLNIVHNQPVPGGPTYGNIESIMRLPKNMPAPDWKSGGYIKFADRSAEDQAAYLAAFRGGATAAPVAAPATKTKAKAKMAQPVGPEDFPAALEDEEDDLPF